MVFSRGELIAVSSSFRRVLDQADLVASTEATVLLTGESGTGKELIAERIHRQSPRSGGPYVICDCSAIPKTLFEGALFGYRRGAFTGAERDNQGYLESAKGGTLFLDEIGEVDLECQAKLLRVLDNGTFVPLGDVFPRKADVRFIAATNKPLEELVSQGRFRQDLYFRLNVINLQIDPLRKRPQDLEPLLTYYRRFFATKQGKEVVGFTPQAMEVLKRWHWPGNVRELKNVVQRAVILCKGTWIDKEDLPPYMSEEDQGSTFEEKTRAFQRRLIREALVQSGGNRREAARRLGLAPHQLKYLLSKLGMVSYEGERNKTSFLN